MASIIPATAANMLAKKITTQNSNNHKEEHEVVIAKIVERQKQK